MLQRTLENVRPNNRVRSPESVWYMFLLPYNFIEDFFIIIDLYRSLDNESKAPKKLQRLNEIGLTLGIGWAVAQLLSFIPNLSGQLSGGIGIILWIAHWILIIRINKLLTAT